MDIKGERIRPDYDRVSALAVMAQGLGVCLALENGRAGGQVLASALEHIGTDARKTGFGICVDTGQAYRNIPIDRIVEDPLFKRSEQSYFIQLVDLAVYALLRRERPIPSKTRYGIHRAFADLAPILVREATRYDAEGIIRP